MDVALIFEVSNQNLNSQVVVQLQNLGYMDSWSSGTTPPVRTYLLPSNMVWKRGISFQDAIRDLQTAVIAVNSRGLGNNLSVVKCITLSAFPWDGIAVGT